MATNIYVGNLPFRATAEDIRDLFGAYGTVESVNLITDRETGRLRGAGNATRRHLEHAHDL